MTSISTARRARTAALTTLALAVGALAATAIGLSPAAHAETIEHSCTTNPGAYAAGGVRGVYSTKRVGNDRDEICSVYDAHGKLLTEYTKADYGFYNRRANLPPGATSPQ
ncbi:hypothetical protein [Mycobacterium sp. 1245805.9]|uniref:hypothetical protein n=1 Tax=Mycobacterium sp. 1245805.9 TaxID=1856862 RepID=UPI000800F8AB|nr:hypothetical protein [Mycobacterium sp. 1245805.9]OBI85362.1 hypothetical protein A9X00_27955 [Mycobacterium sp. 1245805.9]